MEKVYPKVGDGLYLSQRGKSYGLITSVKRPYTVISVSDNEIIIQEDKCIFDPNDNYFDSMPIRIEPCSEGKKVVLHWSDTIHGGCWWAYKDSTGKDYPMVAFFNGRQYFPYLD